MCCLINKHLWFKPFRFLFLGLQQYLETTVLAQNFKTFRRFFGAQAPVESEEINNDKT